MLQAQSEIASAMHELQVDKLQQGKVEFSFASMPVKRSQSDCGVQILESPRYRVVSEALKATVGALSRVRVPAMLWGDVASVWGGHCKDSDRSIESVELFVPADHIVSDEHLGLVVVCHDDVTLLSYVDRHGRDR
jgi:hypothetical protein